MSRISMRLLATAAVVVAALAVQAVQAANGVPDVCVLYGAEECGQHADTCTICHAWNKVDVCMATAIAKRLPKKLFTCDFPPDADCQSFADEGSCSGAPSCVWCVSAAVPSACYTEEEAKRLPAAVFRCKFPSLAKQ